MKTGTVIVANISRIMPRSTDDLHAFGEPQALTRSRLDMIC
jgi:hypothetical protein